jgi:SNF2 family DNA or RNA helicase
VQVRKREVGQVKPKEFVTLPVPLMPLQQVELDRINNEIANGERTAFESGTVLRQICNTLRIVSEVKPILDVKGDPIYDAKGKVKTKSILRYPDIPMADSTNKVAVLKEIIKQKVVVEKKKVVVFSFFKTAVKLLEQELLKDYAVKTITGETARGCKFPKVVQCNKCPKYRYCKMIKKEIWEFVEGDVPVLLGTDSLSRAHNLYTCDTIINFDLPWSSADMEQRIGRIDRANNAAPKLYVINLVTLGTIEERIIRIIETKQKESDKVFPSYNVSLSRLSSTIKIKEGPHELS